MASRSGIGGAMIRPGSRRPVGLALLSPIASGGVATNRDGANITRAWLGIFRPVGRALLKP